MWEFEQISHDEAERRRRRYEPLTASVRGLIEATIGTAGDDEDIAAATAEIDALADRLRRQVHDGPGTSILPDGQGVGWGNMVEGLRNPVAPPLIVQLDDRDRGHIDMELGAAYE